MRASNLANRHSQLLALLFFDLNDFKGVNDELGHEAGDKLLQQVAARLTTVIRKSDTACRYGGDEFVVLLTEICSRERAVTKLNKIRAHLAPPYVVDRYSIRLTVSIGLAIYPKDSDSITELLQTSDRLMFRNKTASRDRSGGTSLLTILPR
jgi:diguanylate cyclase (GGDEF)-like protein